jgi:predicted anti-sigma-YlaC factor YlaD
MVNDARLVDQHVGELLSGLVDGELTQQERQRVVLHCKQCEECRQNLAGLRALRERIGKSQLSELGEDKWRETMNESTVQATRGIGWLLFIAGILAIAGVGLYEFIVEPGMPIWLKLILVAIYGGLAVLLFSVLRQRLIERKTDKYKDVEI